MIDRRHYSLFVLVLFCLFFIFLLTSVNAASPMTSNITVKLTNYTFDTPYPSYDAYPNGSSYIGSFSYRDTSLYNEEYYSLICGLNESYIDAMVDIQYASASRNITYSLVDLKPQIYNYSSSMVLGNDTYYNCSFMDIDLSFRKLKLPGVPYINLTSFINSSYTIENTTEYFNSTTNTTENITENITMDNSTYYSQMEQLDLIFNGSYTIGVTVDGPNGLFKFRVKAADDQSGNPITVVNGDQYIMSAVNVNGSLGENLISSPNAFIVSHIFQGGENISVNGIQSLDSTI